jgi:hypothetical protein
MKFKPIFITAFVLSALIFVSIVSGGDADRLPPIHAIHLEEDLDCETCHEAAATSITGADNLLPNKAICADCHDVDDKTACTDCHSNHETARLLEPIVDRAGNFPHATHLEAEMVCRDCHFSNGRTEAAVPEMTLCRECHTTVSGLQGCATCHGPGEDLVPDTHMAGWSWFHGEQARLDEASCASCHTQTDCQDCHSGDNVRPRSHRLNYAYDHALDARGNEFDCAACHGEPVFCRSCHVENHVMPGDHSRGDWLIPQTGGRHADEGRFDLESCIACHDTDAQTPFCAECHGE